MSRLRVKLILNEGGEGIPFSQLADVSEAAEKFLRYLAADAGINVQRADWLARDFENKSIRFNIEDAGAHDPMSIKEFNRKFGYIAGFQAAGSRLDSGVVQHRTLLQYAKVADALGGHEKLTFGLFRPGEEIPFEWKPLSKIEATALKEKLTEEVVYTGTVQGRIHNIAVADLWFQLRHYRSRSLVRCEFAENQYEEIIDAAHLRRSRIYVRGSVTARRIDREIQKVRVKDIKVAPPLSPERYQAFFGSDPNYTGDLSTSDFVDAAQGYE